MIERNSRKIVSRLKKDGWSCVRVSGSHHIFKHDDFPHLITVPHPKRDLPMGTARAIAREAGWL